MRVGLIGFGAIAQGVARLLRPEDDIQLCAALVRDSTKLRPAGAPPMCNTLDALLATRPEIVVEVAGHAALACHGPGVLRVGVDLVVLSVGALADPAVEVSLREAAYAGKSRLVIASGAIGALDALAAAAVGGLECVTHTTRKPARALLDPDAAARLHEPREVFRGSAREGVLRFPESINVAAAVALAGLGLDRTDVCVIADPALERNTHEVFARGAFGELRFAIAGIPTIENRRTGRLVAMSVVHTLRRRGAWLQLG